jgi:hypothetical protein
MLPGRTDAEARRIDARALRHVLAALGRRATICVWGHQYFAQGHFGVAGFGLAGGGVA